MLSSRWLSQCDVLSIVEVQGHWVFMLTQKQNISELIDQCQQLRSCQTLVIHYFFQVMVSAKVGSQSVLRDNS